MFPTAIISPKYIPNSQTFPLIKHSKTTNFNSKLIINPLFSIRNVKKFNLKDSSNKHHLQSNNRTKASINKSRKILNINLFKKNIQKNHFQSFQLLEKSLNKPDWKKFKDIERKNQREIGNVEYFTWREKSLLAEDRECKVDFKGN